MRNSDLQGMREDLLIGIVWEEAKTFRTGRGKNWRRKSWRLQKLDKNARDWIEKLQLEPHPEGGYFRQTYKADPCQHCTFFVR